MLHFEPFEGSLDDWGAVLERYPDRDIFQTAAWLRFVQESQDATPVVAVLRDGADEVGHFAGLVVRRGGMRILGSPFIGWTTVRMGIRLLADIPKRAAAEALCEFAFRRLGCGHLELSDRGFGPQDLASMGFEHSISYGTVVDLRRDEEQIYQGFSNKSCRYCLRKAEKLGVTVEPACDETFADDYFPQLEDVFAKQSLVPTYDKRRVQLLCKHLLPTGNLLLLRARAPDGRCIATGIFVGMNTTAYFWGNASWRQDQHFCPNEAIHWYAMRYWRSRGIQTYDLCGGGAYKLKYGGQEQPAYYFRKSKYRWIGWARSVAKRVFQMRQRIRGWGKGAVR